MSGSITYESELIYIQSRTTILAKITAIEAIISALETTALTAASTGNIDEYSLDDGQVKIKTTYRNVTQIAKSIQDFETIRQRYINHPSINGRYIRLVDAKSFT